MLTDPVTYGALCIVGVSLRAVVRPLFDFLSLIVVQRSKDPDAMLKLAELERARRSGTRPPPRNVARNSAGAP